MAPTPADHEILLWSGVESEDEAQVRVLVHGGHHHPEDQDQQSRVQRQLCHTIYLSIYLHVFIVSSAMLLTAECGYAPLYILVSLKCFPLS